MFSRSSETQSMISSSSSSDGESYPMDSSSSNKALVSILVNGAGYSRRPMVNIHTHLRN